MASSNLSGSRTVHRPVPRPIPRPAPRPGALDRASQGLRRGLRALHGRLRRSGLALRLVVGTRVLLATAFLPTGLVKVLGRPFTSLGTDQPIGLFFHALHGSGIYWQFLGAMQMLAAVLVLIPATSALGAALFLAIIVNIALITIGLSFGLTAWITSSMVLAALLLMAWDYHRWESLLFRPRPEDGFRELPASRPTLSRLEGWVYGAGLVAGMALFSAARSLAPQAVFAPALLVAALAVLAALALGLWAWFRHRCLDLLQGEEP